MQTIKITITGSEDTNVVLKEGSKNKKNDITEKIKRLLSNKSKLNKN